jgi:hypothetical protein
MPEGPPSNKQVYAVYRQTILKQSTSADVLAAFGSPDYGLLSQSKSIIALAGQKKKGYASWFNMVSFDENELIAKRKCAFISDERPKQLFVQPWEGVDFKCETVLPRDVLDENARRIAILKQIGSDIRKDTSEVGADNKVVSLCGMIVGQGMDTALVNIESSPALAGRLSEPNGLAFEHISFNRGLLRMVVDEDVATVRLRLGSFAKGGKLSFEGLGSMDE